MKWLKELEAWEGTWVLAEGSSLQVQGYFHNTENKMIHIMRMPEDLMNKGRLSSSLDMTRAIKIAEVSLYKCVLNFYHPDYIHSTRANFFNYENISKNPGAS